MKHILLGLYLLGFIGCGEIEISDGNIPDNYLSYAQNVMGTYKGKFQGRVSTFKLRLEGSNHPIVRFEDHIASDLIGADCNSEVGDLLALKVSKKKEKMVEAVFALNPGSCKVLGKTLTLSFSKSEKMRASILKSELTILNCDNDHPPHLKGCKPSKMPFYLTGKFEKLD